MKFKMIERGNPSQPSAPKKWYPSAGNAGKFTVKDFAKEIAGRSSLLSQSLRTLMTLKFLTTSGKSYLYAERGTQKRLGGH